MLDNLEGKHFTLNGEVYHLKKRPGGSAVKEWRWWKEMYGHCSGYFDFIFRIVHSAIFLATALQFSDVWPALFLQSNCPQCCACLFLGHATNNSICPHYNQCFVHKPETLCNFFSQSSSFPTAEFSPSKFENFQGKKCGTKFGSKFDEYIIASAALELTSALISACFANFQMAPAVSNDEATNLQVGQYVSNTLQFVCTFPVAVLSNQIFKLVKSSHLPLFPPLPDDSTVWIRVMLVSSLLGSVIYCTLHVWACFLVQMMGKSGVLVDHAVGFFQTVRVVVAFVVFGTGVGIAAKVFNHDFFASLNQQYSVFSLEVSYGPMICSLGYIQVLIICSKVLAFIGLIVNLCLPK